MHDEAALRGDFLNFISLCFFILSPWATIPWGFFCEQFISSYKYIQYLVNLYSIDNHSFTHFFQHCVLLWDTNGFRQMPQPTSAERGTIIVRQMVRTIWKYFPKLFEDLASLPDPRKRRYFSMAELLMGCIALFLFKQGSRNALNNQRCEANFRRNYERLLGLSLPHMDTADAVLRLLSPNELEELKASLIAALIEQKVLQHTRLVGKYYTLAIDATGAHSYHTNDAEQTRLHKTSKTGKTSYSHYVMEARLVSQSGFSLSVATEWVANDTDRNYQKQDCESRAFQRLAIKLKRHFPRMPVCLLADGLYANQSFMKTCTDNGWKYIVVLKDDSLKQLQTDIADTHPKEYQTIELSHLTNKGSCSTQQHISWINTAFAHKENQCYWLKCAETTSVKTEKVWAEKSTKNFVWLTNIVPHQKNIIALAQAGRMRWKIENEGFNTLKNQGYALQHLYSRQSFTATQNYYQCMQIAHSINQLIEHSIPVQNELKAHTKITLKYLWLTLMQCMAILELPKDFIATQISTKYQIRLRKR